MEELKITITKQELALLSKALGVMPYVEVAQLIDKIFTQVKEQQDLQKTT